MQGKHEGGGRYVDVLIGTVWLVGVLAMLGCITFYVSGLFENPKYQTATFVLIALFLGCFVIAGTLQAWLLEGPKRPGRDRS